MLNSILPLLQTVCENGLVLSIVVLSLFLSYKMLNVCDLSTDGCYTLGACVGAMVALTGHPVLAIFAAIGAGMISGFVTGLLQTKMGIDSLLSGIIVNTALYSINIAIMGEKSEANLNKVDTIFTYVKSWLSGTPFAKYYRIIILLVIVALIVVFLRLFLHTKLGLSIRATGDNPIMVKMSSINPHMTTMVCLCISGGMTALSGTLMAQMQKSSTIDIGTGVVTIALASLLIGGIFTKKRKITGGAIGAVVGAIIFRLVYAIALSLNMPAFMLKFISSVIVVLAIFVPHCIKKYPTFVRKIKLKAGK